MRSDLVLKAWAERIFSEGFRDFVRATIRYRNEDEDMTGVGIVRRLPDARPAHVFRQRDVSGAYIVVDPLWSPV
jgi:hypothetical protein